MDIDAGTWVGAVGGAFGAIGAVGAWIVAIRANGRAKDALDLQSRIDEREREYRDVAWRAGYDAIAGITLTNEGLTDAHGVHLVLYGTNRRELHRLGNVSAGRSIAVPSEAAGEWMLENARSMPVSPPFAVHWSSPLGVADRYHAPAVTLFMLPDDVED